MTGTFRDPSGSLFDVDGRILRNIRGPQAAAFRSMVDSAVVKSLIERGLLVATRPIEASEVPAALRGRDGEWFGHERIGFVSVPAEWSAMMLAHAARHTLTIGLELLRDGYVLKDATPANVLFRGARPVFVDLPSIERFAGGNGLWLARHQFETCFLLPLMASLDLGYPIQSALADPATGLSHERLARLYGPRRWWSVDRVRHVALAAALGGGTRGAEAALARPTSGRASDLEKAKYVLEQSLRGLLRAIDRLEGRLRQRDSHWSAYAATRSHYADEDLRLKREFVGAVLEAGKPCWVLDVGANTGEFSMMAAAVSAETVAVDLDEVSVSAIHATAAGSRLPIQALVVDLSQPTPASGWCNHERKSFLERAQGRFDLALMLAVGHHLRVTAGIPLDQILDTGLRIGGGSLLFEFVPTTDPMFRSIARGREPLYADNTVENCRTLLESRGRIEKSVTLPNGRTLFWVRGAAVG